MIKSKKTIFLISILSLFIKSCSSGGINNVARNQERAAEEIEIFNPITEEPILGWQDIEDGAEDIYRTAEYTKQWGLEKINAAKAYALLAANNKPIAGSGAKISVVDTGALMTHQEISANYNPTNHYDFINYDNDPTDDNKHGTHVASIAAGVKDDKGMHGVAYNAETVAFKVLSGSGKGSFNSVHKGIKRSSQDISDVDVINLSLGGASPSNSVNTIKQAANSDIVLTIATGNSSKKQPSYPAYYASDPEVAGYVIAVGSINENAEQSYFSNECGDTKYYCLFAPGENIYAAYIKNNKSYTILSGTSMATPHVAGAVAVIRAAWPHLTAPQTTEILLTTATDLGDEGVDNVFGYGLLNLGNAVQAQGKNLISFGSKVDSAGYELSDTFLTTNSIFGDAFIAKIAPKIKSTIFTDKYGRDYKAFLNKKILPLTSSSNTSLESVFFNNNSSRIIPINIKNNSFAFKIPNTKDLNRDNLGSRFATIDNSFLPKNNNAQGFSFRSANNLFKEDIAIEWGFAFNIDEISNSRKGDLFKNDNSLLKSDNFTNFNPYQNFFSQPSSHNIDNNRNYRQFYINKSFFDKNINLSFSHQSSYDNKTLEGFNNKQNENIDLGIDYNINNKNNISFLVGNLKEFDNNMLNSKSLGAFESKNNPTTSYIKLNSNHKITENTNLTINFSEGITKIKGNEKGIFRNYSDIRSRSLGIALIYDKSSKEKISYHQYLKNNKYKINLKEFAKGGFGIAYSQPLRVYKGKLNYNIPFARNNKNDLYRISGYASLVPDGKEENFEIFYLANIGQNNQIKFNFLSEKESGNNKNSQTQYLGAFFIKKEF